MCMCKHILYLVYSKIFVLLFDLQNGTSGLGLLHKSGRFSSLVAIRRKASTPINTVIMFVPQQEVGIGIIGWITSVATS